MVHKHVNLQRARDGLKPGADAPPGWKPACIAPHGAGQDYASRHALSRPDGGGEVNLLHGCIEIQSGHWHGSSFTGFTHPMKLLAVTDLHFGLKQFDWVVQQAERYDLVIIAGDLLDMGGHLDLDSQITIVVKYLRIISAKTRLLVCSGNHDGDEKNEAQEYIARWLQRLRGAGLVVDGGSAEISGIRCSVCPWWDGPTTRATMQQFLRTEHATAPGSWLWVHHAPPNGVGVSWTGKDHAGDDFLVELIRELSPDFVFSGHIHNSPFRTGGAWAARIDRTWVFNPGKQLGVPPAYIELDLEKRSAHWVSQAGDEEIFLDVATVQPA